MVSAPAPRRGRAAATLSGSRDLIRIAYRDPEHVSERLTLYAARMLGEPSRVWAEQERTTRRDMSVANMAEEQRVRSAGYARIEGAISGTPFLIALVPGYLSYLWEEARMGLRIAALYGRDPASLRTAAEILALRGVHPDPDTAEAALREVQRRPAPEKPAARRPLRMWITSGYTILVFGGFLSRSEGTRARGLKTWLLAAATGAVAFAIWVTTWIFPITFMIAMAWGCESHVRDLGRRAIAFYDGEAASVAAAADVARARRDRGHDRRRALRTIALGLSIAVPIAFVAYVDRVRNVAGLNWLSALGALVALSLVIATAVAASRR